MNPRTTPTESSSIRPRIDVHETSKALLLVADLPGVAEDGVELHLEDDVLTLRARAAIPAPEGWESVRSEFARADFERRLRLAVEVDRTAIQATLEAGSLRVTLPRKAPAASRIEIRRA